MKIVMALVCFIIELLAVLCSSSANRAISENLLIHYQSIHNHRHVIVSSSPFNAEWLLTISENYIEKIKTWASQLTDNLLGFKVKCVILIDLMKPPDLSRAFSA